MKNPNGRGRMGRCVYALTGLLAAVLALCPVVSSAQQLTGTLSGTAYDQSGAVVPKASVVLRNEASGDARTTVTGSDGHFVITAVQPGSYSVEVSAIGFSSWKENGITMNTGDSRDVPNIKLTVGGEFDPGQRSRRSRRGGADRHCRDQHHDQHPDDQRLSACRP